MSSATAVSNNVVKSQLPPNSNAKIVNGEKNGANTSSTITTTAKSLSSTITASSKRSRKQEQHHNNHHQQQALSDNTNFLPIAPQQGYLSTNQGLTLASVQQQLQPGSVAVFTSPTMAMATLAGQQGAVPQQANGQAQQMASQQQLVVAAPGQTMGPTQLSSPFNAPNGQTQHLIQTQGMGMMGGLPQVQVIQAGANGQPAYFQQFYGQMQPMLLGGNLTMAIQAPNTPQGLAIQIPNGNGGTMIAANQLGSANTPTTPIKNQQTQQPILKGVTISPQQPQATKSGGNNLSAQHRGQQSQQTQQTIIQQSPFQQGNPNPTFVIGTFPGSSPSQNGTAIMPTTPTTSRKGSGSGRSNSSGNKGSNIIQKIQPATNNMTSPILAPAQFKSGTSPFSTAQNSNAPANGQTIMVHGQSIQTGSGGIQIAPNQPTILSPLTSFSTLQPGITWATAPINQQSTQLMAQNGQFFIRAQGQNTDQPHMLIQTSNNQFQAVPMQMNQANQQQAQTHGAMQMAQAGQQIVASSINQSMPISIQTNQGVAMSQTSIMTNQANHTTSSNLLTSVCTTASVNTPTSASNANSSRQRLIRPAGMQSTIATQTAAGKQKNSADNNRASTGNIVKLAPKNPTSGIQNVLPRSSIGGQNIKLPLPSLAKTTAAVVDSANQVSKLSSTSSTTSATTTTASKSTVPKTTSVSTSVSQSVTSSMASTTVSSTTTTTDSTSPMNPPTTGNLVNSSTSTQNTLKVTSSVQTTSKVNRKPEKKDNSNATDAKNHNSTTSTPLGVKSKSSTAVRNSNVKTNGPVVGTQNSSLLVPNTQMINGVLCQMPTNPQVKTSMTNGTSTVNKIAATTNGNISKSAGQNNAKNSSANKAKNKQQQQPDNLVLTHVIDGYVIQESPNPFPINGFINSTDSDTNTEKNSQINNEVSKSDTKENGENVQINKEEPVANGLSQKENNILNGNVLSEQQTQVTAKPKANSLCIACGIKERMQGAKKKKLKKFCSQICHDTHMQNKQQQQQNSVKFVATNGQALMGQPPPLTQPSTIAPQTQLPMFVSLPAANPVQPVLNGNNTSRVLGQNSVPTTFAPLPFMSPSLGLPTQTPAPTLNGQLSGVKRPLNPSNGIDPKRSRISSPVTNKTTEHQAQTNNKNQNGIQSDSKEVTKAESGQNDMPELEGLWLPASGKKEPNKWTVQEVYDFVFHLDGCSEFAEEFRTQEIDGQALMLIKEDHIIAILNMKLGPALKICRKIKDLKSAFSYL